MAEQAIWTTVFGILNLRAQTQFSRGHFSDRTVSALATLAENEITEMVDQFVYGE